MAADGIVIDEGADVVVVDEAADGVVVDEAANGIVIDKDALAEDGRSTILSRGQGKSAGVPGLSLPGDGSP